MTAPLLLCTDLDRTLIPNGEAPESPGARAAFARFVAANPVTLVYVTGRHRALVEAAIREFALPRPDFVIGDVGSSLHALTDDGWRDVPDWAARIGADWGEGGRARLEQVCAALPELRPQEAEKQTPLKLSFYAPLDLDIDSFAPRLRALLEPTGHTANPIWSLDEAAGVGLLDLLPPAASKRHAIDYLFDRLGMDPLGRRHARTVFAGDSGNDLEVLVSAIPAVLVANASAEVREQARTGAAAQGQAAALYLAQGGWQGLNGCYSAGILEGIAHFHPDLEPALIQSLKSGG